YPRETNTSCAACSSCARRSLRGSRILPSPALFTRHLISVVSLIRQSPDLAITTKFTEGRIQLPSVRGGQTRLHGTSGVTVPSRREDEGEFQWYTTRTDRKS